MCMSLSETKRGLWETQEDIRTLRDDFPDAVAAELDNIWMQIRDKAIELCPKESGALASSIELESEGGSGSVSAAQGGVIYENAIYAGNDSTYNFEGQPSSQYALSVHDGHMMANGDFWEGCPFLEDALDYYDSALSEAVDAAMQNLGI